MTKIQMKINFTGTQETGKTTSTYSLSTELKKRKKDVNIITEAARSCPFEINEGATIEAQLWILAKMMERELESKAEITICDRTLLDVLVYTERVAPPVANDLKPFIAGFMKSYDVIFYMDINKDFLIDDGIRSTNKEFQNEIKELLDLNIDALDVEVVRLDSDKERLDFVLEMIEK